MRYREMRRLLALGAMGCLAAASVRAAQPVATFEARDILGLDWPRTMVTYQPNLEWYKVKGDLRLIDASGRELPCQIWDVTNAPDGTLFSARVAFMTDLRKNESYRYQLLAEKPTRTFTNACRITSGKDGVTLDNGAVAIRLPPEGSRRFNPPLRMGTAHDEMTALYGRQVEKGVIPGPVQGVRLLDGKWIGGSYFLCVDPTNAPRATGCVCRVTNQGPLFADAAVRYTFDNGGFYEFSCRLSAGDPAIRVDERSDMKVIGDEWQWRVVFSLAGSSRDWQPDTTWWCTSEGRMPGKDAAFDRAMESLGFETNRYQGVEFGVKRIAFDKPDSKVFDMAVWYPWHPVAFYFGLADSRAFSRPGAQRAAVPFLGVVPMHAGNWRGAIGPYNGMLFAYPGGDLAMHWPLVAKPHPNTLLHTGEYDDRLPPSFLRRQWALVAGPLQYHDALLGFRRYDGFVTLDDYKDWTLSWGADANVTYPRLVFDTNTVEKLRGQLDNHPGADVLRTHLYFKDDVKRREELYNQMNSRGFWGGPLGQTIENLGLGGAPWQSSFRQAQGAGWAGNADELLASKELFQSQRNLVRSYIAAVCCALSEPDMNPRGCMVHLGNPNMPINRFLALPFAAALIPDHPRAKEWLDVSAQYVRYKLAMNTAPLGGWSELITYFPASAPHLMQAAMVLGRTGRLDEPTTRLAAMPAKFTLQLLSPKDYRFGTRMLPNWGHEGYDIGTHWMVAATLMRNLDPELAKGLVWAWDQLGRPMTQHHDAGFSERVIVNADLLNQLAPGYVPPQLASAWIPGFGATMRAHAGDPNEVFMAFRAGYLVSHCDGNQNDFIIYARGAPLTTMSLHAYAIHNDGPFGKLCKEFGWHNRVRFGSRSNDGGWPGGGLASQVHAHFFSDSVDYARSEGDYGPQRWQRQIMLIKSPKPAGPNYFVIRDGFTAAGTNAAALEAKWWYLRTLGKKDRVTLNDAGLKFAGATGAGLEAHFIQPARVAGETRDATQAGPLYNQAAKSWHAVNTAPSNRTQNATVDDVISVTAFGPVAVGQNILVCLYPQAPGEAAPGCESLADGVAKITTSEGADYVFFSAGENPIAFSNADVAFTGMAGAVRVRGGEVHLVMAEGPGSVAYRETVLKSPVPSHRVVPMAQLRKEVVEVAAIKHGLQFAPSRADAPAVEVQPGVKRYEWKDGFAYTFDSSNSIAFATNDVLFSGTKGGIEVSLTTNRVRLVMLEGAKIGYGKLVAWGCQGPYDLTFHADQITGRYAGLDRILYTTRPERLDKLPMYVLDGQTYAPGTSGDTLILPLIEGEHSLDIRVLPQPPIWRKAQAW